MDFGLPESAFLQYCLVSIAEALPLNWLWFHQEFMLTLTSLHELEVDDIISGMPVGAFAQSVFAVSISFE